MSGAAHRPLASLSIDLDDQWTYLKSRADPRWRSMPSFYDPALPRALDFLRSHGLRATFFVVGSDAERPQNQALLRRIADEGHEIGNHSHQHEPWLHTYERAALEEEILRAEEAIEAATGRRPRGFRGPGHSVTPAVLEILKRRGYLYDASPLPTFLIPLMRRLYFRGVRMSRDEREQRRHLGGGFRSVFAPNRPSAEAGSVVVVPVTTLPLLRLPFHGTYLNTLQAWSPRLARGYFELALALCRATRTAPSFLLHLTDFLGSEDGLEVPPQPWMSVPLARKLSLLDTIIRRLAGHYRIAAVEDHAASVVRPRGAV